MTEKIVIYSDGASRGNPGPAAIGAVLKDSQGKPLAFVSECIGITTNNQAEYQAIIAALEKAIKLGAHRVDIKLDSELVVRQVNGQYRVKHPALKPLHEKLGQLLSKMESFSIVCVPREYNAEADRLANRALNAARQI